jgi:polysaccharide export outer membrane protein
MRSRWVRWLRGKAGLFVLCLGLLGGCASTQSRVNQALVTDNNPVSHAHDLDAQYRLRCPDVLEITIEGHSDQSGKRPVGPDGRIWLDECTNLRVTGRTPVEIAQTVAGRLKLASEDVHVKVAEHNSQSLYLFSEIEPLQKVVPYQGPETIIDLLQRVGAKANGINIGEVQVVRSHVADGRPPEIFRVDLAAILLKHDPQTNIRLEPFDRIYISQTRRAQLCAWVPHYLQPLYREVCGLK